MRGFVIRSQSGFFTAETEAGQLACRLRGRLLKGRREGDVVAIGDWVEITQLGAKEGVIEAVEPRQRMFARLAPRPQGEYLQILIANPDQAVIVFACAHPTPRLGMLDRFLAIAEKGQTPAVIVANKVDLVGLEAARETFGHYTALGYTVLYTSVKQQIGLDEIKAVLHNKVSLLTGPSGVGKSSLLNAVQPGLGLQVRQVSQATSKGTHTTVTRELFPLDGGGYVADTPGLKALALWDMRPEEIDAYFPELRDLVEQCQFSDCTHVHEPGCAVLAAVEDGRVHPLRYRSYINMRFGEE